MVTAPAHPLLILVDISAPPVLETTLGLDTTLVRIECSAAFLDLLLHGHLVPGLRVAVAAVASPTVGSVGLLTPGLGIRFHVDEQRQAVNTCINISQVKL